MNQLQKIEEVIRELQNLKRIENTILHRENRGFPKDGNLILDFAKSKLKAVDMLTDIQRSV